MKLHFEADLPYQSAAIKAVCQVHRSPMVSAADPRFGY